MNCWEHSNFSLLLKKIYESLIMHFGFSTSLGGKWLMCFIYLASNFTAVNFTQCCNHISTYEPGLYKYFYQKLRTPCYFPI